MRDPLAVFLTNCVAGGTERQMIELLHRRDRPQWETHLVCFGGGRWLPRIADSVSVATFPVTTFLHPAATGQLAACAALDARHRRAFSAGTQADSRARVVERGLGSASIQ